VILSTKGKVKGKNDWDIKLEDSPKSIGVCCGNWDNYDCLENFAKLLIILREKIAII
jgi:hypothetical protein